MAFQKGLRPSRGGPRKGGKRGDRKKSQAANLKQKKQQKRLRLEQGGSLPKRPDIKGLENDRPNKKGSSKSGVYQEKQKGRHQGKPWEDARRPRGPPKRQEPHDHGAAGEAPEKPRKRKLANGQERLRALLDKHPNLLRAGESTDAAVAACFKKTGRILEESGGEAAAEADADTSKEQQEQHLSGSKRRKLLRLVMNSRTADDKIFVHESYQLYNEILRSIRRAEGAESSPSLKSEKCLKSRVAKAISFLEEPLAKKDRHCCTARLAQICLKHADGDARAKLWEMLFRDFEEFCCCKSFHHVAMKLFLYGTEEQKAKIVDRLGSRRDTALTKHGATVWDYIYSAQKTSLAQQKILNYLVLDPPVLVAVPKANEAHSFAQVVDLLSAAQRKQTLENVGNLIQKFVDKELLNKAHVHRIIKGFCSVASAEELTATWKTISEGALHLATTKDGVEALVRLLGYASAKERKSVVKALKQHCVAFATNPVDCPLLLRLLLTVDDTKLLTEQIVKELLPAAIQLAFDSYGYFLLLQLLHPEGICKQLPANYQDLLALPSPTSLKAAATRQAELQPAVVAAVAAAVAELPLESSEKEQQSIVGALKHGCASKVLVQLAQYPQAERALLRVMASLKHDLQQKSPSLMGHPVAQRALSALVKAGEPSVLQAAWAALATNLACVLETKGVFVVLQALKTARELKVADVEAEIQKRLDGKLLASAEAAVTKAGSPATGIQLLRTELGC